MSYLRYWTQGHYGALLSWAIAQKARKGMSVWEMVVAYGFDDQTIERMIGRTKQVVE